MTRGNACRDDEDTAAGLDTAEAPSSGENGAALPSVPLRQRQSKPKPAAPELPVRSAGYPCMLWCFIVLYTLPSGVRGARHHLRHHRCACRCNA